jgi:galactokinase
MAYNIKSHGLSYLRHAVSHRNKKLNYISLPVDKAQEILEASKEFQPSKSDYNARSNSVKGAAVVLAMDVKELISRLNAPMPAQLLNDLAEARNKIKALEKAGDNLAIGCNNKGAIKAWVDAKTFV